MSKKDKNKAPYIGVDLGGTKILVALVSHKGKILEREKQPTMDEEGPDAVIARIAETVRQTLRKAGLNTQDVAGIGVGTPGVVDSKRGVVHIAPNLSGWHEIPLGQELEKRLERPVVVGNDVNVATYGEYTLGPGTGCKAVASIFPGTGIGGALIFDGKLWEGAHGAAGEIGHIILESGGPICGCGRQGCAEAVASRTALERDLRTAIRFGRQTVLSKMIAETEPIRSGILAQAAREGDTLVLEVLARTARYLGLLTASLVNLVDPEMVILGGGLIVGCQEWLMPTIRGVAREHFIDQADADTIRIEIATLGDDAGVLGAAMLAKSVVSGQPTGN